MAIPIEKDIPNGALVIYTHGEWSECPNRATNVLQGIEYARYLRRVEKNIRPILFISFEEANAILEYPNTSIITAIGHGFVKLPISDEEEQEAIDKIKPLNDIQLKDVIINFCEFGSAVRDGFHAFKGRLQLVAPQNLTMAQKIKLYEEEFMKYEEELKRETSDYPEVLLEYRRIIQQFNHNEEDSIDKIILTGDEVFLKYIPKDENAQQVIEERKIDWKVLFLDDQPLEIEPLFAVLRERNIKYIIVNTVEEAKSVIEADEDNNIAVVVTDYRLLTKREGWVRPVLQDEQGYDFLLWLYKQDRLNAMIALSGLSKWFLMDSFRQQQINVKVYSKSNLMGNGAALFTDDLEHYGERIHEAILFKPTSKEEWELLKPYYKWLRTVCIDTDKIESEIDQKASKIIEDLDGQYEAYGGMENFKYLRLQDHVGRGSEAMPSGFQEKNVELFKLKLIYRRIFIYYALKKTIDLNIVAKLLNLGSADAVVYDNENNETKDFLYKGMKKLIFNKIALLERDIPYNILIEEKNWLKNKMGIEIIKAQTVINQLHPLLKYHFDIIAPTLRYGITIPKFDEIFLTGKSVTAINNDLRTNLLQPLSNGNQHEFLRFISDLRRTIVEIKLLIKPYRAYNKILDTLDSYLKK
jgi:hypothetical protein